jgi:hypothetical protein
MMIRNDRGLRPAHTAPPSHKDVDGPPYVSAVLDHLRLVFCGLRSVAGLLPPTGGWGQNDRAWFDDEFWDASLEIAGPENTALG